MSKYDIFTKAQTEMFFMNDGRRGMIFNERMLYPVNDTEVSGSDFSLRYTPQDTSDAFTINGSLRNYTNTLMSVVSGDDVFAPLTSIPMPVFYQNSSTGELHFAKNINGVKIFRDPGSGALLATYWGEASFASSIGLDRNYQELGAPWMFRSLIKVIPIYVQYDYITGLSGGYNLVNLVVFSQPLPMYDNSSGIFGEMNMAAKVVADREFGTNVRLYKYEGASPAVAGNGVVSAGKYVSTGLSDPFDGTDILLANLGLDADYNKFAGIAMHGANDGEPLLVITASQAYAYMKTASYLVGAEVGLDPVTDGEFSAAATNPLLLMQEASAGGLARANFFRRRSSAATNAFSYCDDITYIDEANPGVVGPSGLGGVRKFNPATNNEWRALLSLESPGPATIPAGTRVEVYIGFRTTTLELDVAGWFDSSFNGRGHFDLYYITSTWTPGTVTWATKPSVLLADADVLYLYGRDTIDVQPGTAAYKAANDNDGVYSPGTGPNYSWFVTNFVPAVDCYGFQINAVPESVYCDSAMLRGFISQPGGDQYSTRYMLDPVY